MTERIYESDSYCRSFRATVESCTLEGENYVAVLNRSAFFPEGGGQAADEGTINGIKVLDVQRKGDIVYHTIESELPVGEEVTCELDWGLRYSRMQSHTGEHILSGVVHALFGYDNVGFHMGSDWMQVDFNGALTQEDIEKIERMSNEAVYANADIVAFYPTPEEAKDLNFRSKIELGDDMRIVKIGEDIDCCACCAPHLAKTGEVGLIKVVNFYSFKQGTRIEMLAGIEALRDYMGLNAANKELMKLLSVPREKVVEAVRERHATSQALRGELQRVSKKLAFYELEKVELGDAVYAFASGLNFDELRYCANALIDGGKSVCMLISKNEDDSYIYVVSSKDADVRAIVKQLNETFSGKGGGQSTYAQGKLAAAPESDIRSFAEKALQ